MDLEDASRVSNPPPPEPSTSTSVDASYSLGPRQPLLQQASNIDNVSYLDGADLSHAPIAPVTANPPLSKSEILGPTENIQTRAGPVDGPCVDSQTPIRGISLSNSGSFVIGNSVPSNHPMAILRNRIVGLPALAAGLVPTSTVPVTKTPAETSQSFFVPSESKLAAPALINLAPKINNIPDDNDGDRHEQLQDITPLPVSSPLTTPLTASKQQTQQTPGKSSLKSRKRKIKRRRMRDSDDEIKANDSSSDDVSDDMLPVARQTKSGRQVNRPAFFAPSPEIKQSPRQRPSPSGSGATPTSGNPAKRRRRVYRKNGKDINVTCTHCQRGHSPATNSIVFCDECNDAWHQFCHDPPIDKEVIEVKEAEWFCRECRPGRPVTLLKLRLPPKTQPVSAQPPQGPLVCGSRFTAEEQRAYLSSLSHAALVDMLCTLSNTNATLPIFPENLRNLYQSKFVTTPSTTLSTSYPSFESASPEKSKATETVTEQSRDVESSDARPDSDEDSDDSGSEYEVEEHRLYPRPGNGFCLRSEEDDLDILLDDPACPTFSYTLHGYSQTNALADNSLTIKVAG